MAELKSTTAIGGNIVWHGGNLRFDPQGDSVLYDGHKIYTEFDKPDPHTDLTESVVKRSGDVMTGTLSLQKVGQAMLIGGGDSLNGDDAWIRIGNLTYAWDLKYVGSTSGTNGNEFRIQSINTDRYWQMDHDGNFQYYDGASIRAMLHTGNYTSYLDSRYAKLAGDTFTGAVTFGGGDVTLYDTGSVYSHELKFRNSAKQMGIDFSTSGLLRFIDRDLNSTGIFFDIPNEAIHADGDISSDSDVSASRLYAGTSKTNGYFYSDQNGRTAFRDGDLYIQSSVGTTYLYSDTIYLGDTSGSMINARGNKLYGNKWEFAANGGLNMINSDISFDNGYGIHGESSSYFLKFNIGEVHMSSLADITIEADSNDNETSRYLNLKSGLNTLRVRGGAADNNAVEFNGHDIVHMGNYTTKLDGRYVNATGDTMSGDLTMGGNYIYGGTTGYYLNLNAGNSGPMLRSNAQMILHADYDGSGSSEFIELRSGNASATPNALRINSTAGAQDKDALTFNDSKVQHDGRSEMQFDDGTASIEYNPSTNSIDFVFA